MADWSMIRLRDACDSVDYGLTASASPKETGTRFLRITDIVGDSLSWKDVPFVAASEEQAEKYRVSPGDIVIARTGATTGVSRWLDKIPGSVVFASYLVRLKISDRYDSRFIGYVLKGDQFWDYVRGVLGDKSAQPNASATTLVAAPLSVPSDIVEQRRIAGVLGALDDKISLNERISQTSLELAQSYYEREARASDGWREWALRDTAKWHSGGTPKTSEPSYWNGDIPWISAASLKKPWLYESARSVTPLGAQSGTRLVPRGAILFVVRGMSLTSEFRIGLAQREIAFGQDCKALVPYSGFDSATLFLAVRARSREILDMVDLAGHGTGRLETGRVEKLTVQLPCDATDLAFTQRVRSLVDVSVAAAQENRSFTTLRDTLLPQLMSGKLRVRDAEKIVEDAV
ncbi:restriction endonuclease subunit S [Streptomyces sp. NPDC059904]|uniref:restriction endonuclease subunit S n=1 Tax=Streptomyces sp. NPDC059904 TaxID=3346996 RepID=UPI00364CF6A0